MQKIMLMGNVGRDPEIRMTRDGKEVASFSVAVTEKWKDQSGQRQESTEWFKISVFGKQTNVVRYYIKKGSKLFIEGKIKSEKWTDKNGVEKTGFGVVANNFVMLDSRTSSGSAPQSAENYLDDDIFF